jgi:outer membrane biosynthesis protein TonB
MSAVNLYKEDRKNSLISYGITLLVHAALFLLLWFAVIMPPDPPLTDMGGSGMLISLGEENMGGPDLIPVEEITTDPQPPQPEQPVEEQQTLTQDAEDAPEIEAKKDEKKKTEVKKVEDKKTEVKKTPEKKIEKPVEQPRKVDERALFKKKNNAGTSSGHGDGEIPGNEGHPDGDPNGSPDGNGQPGNGGNGSGYGTGNGVGNGSGDGVGSFELRGRSLSRRPDITENSRETGKVVVSIVVDRNGKVIKATPGQKGSTTLSPTLLEKAKQGAFDARFSPKPDGPEEQYGTITFVFKFKQ